MIVISVDRRMAMAFWNPENDDGFRFGSLPYQAILSIAL